MAHNIVSDLEPANCSAQLCHLDGDEHLGRAAGVRAAQGGDISIVAAVADPDVTFRDSGLQRRVVSHPRAAPPLDPGVALTLYQGVGPGVAARMQITRDVTSGQADRPECAQGQMRVVLAYSLGPGPYVDGLGVHSSAAAGIAEPVGDQPADVQPG